MKRFLKRIHQGNKGFTLIELLIVIAILGVLAAVIVPNVTGFIGRGEEEAARAELATVQTAMDMAMVDKTLSGETPVNAQAAPGITDFSTVDIDPSDDTVYLYPDYIRTKNASAVRLDGETVAAYSWDIYGFVTSTAFDADGVWQ